METSLLVKAVNIFYNIVDGVKYLTY